ncbi:stemmadenine O-acetyltransferase-like [Gastrolobium bilobum]|uniref:stemmadenine O-acetyltransferase-like n=1 Tax=Gastrolobium bilobum TaxID=150636 RepID=UPI002AB14916|nr:stemmadenine O-acetyltransferase-like [Gastrolobium bilobum]
MEMELISRETIKPSASTPPSLTNYPLSLIDNIVAPNSVPLLHFYPNKSCEHDSYDAPGQVYDQGSKILMLKKSLSKVLHIYYPVAGRLKDKRSIDCNDQGVSLLVTRFKCKLFVVAQNPSEALLNPLFPDELNWKDMGSSSSLVAIQINCFECGGMAISVCMSHKVGDISTLFNFINDWANLNRFEEGELTFPVFDVGASMFPQGDLPVLPEFVFVKQNTACRRLVFDGSKIESLKAIVSSHQVENPTRVEVVIALIYKCAVSALRLNNNTPLLVTINLRRRMVPPLPDKSIGNLVWSFSASNQCMEHEREMELHDSVSKMREGLSEFCDKNVKNFGDFSFVYEFLKKVTSFLEKKKQASSTSVSPDKEKESSFFFASWCRFPIYEADFGWGKPIWVTTSGCSARNSIILMDTRDGDGIEALVFMEEKDMVMFERDVELLQYASLSPNRWTC